MDLFFDAWTTSAGQPDTVGRPIVQFAFEFVPATPDGFRMEAGNLRDPFETAMSQTLGLAGRHPAPLLLIQTTQQQIELLVIFTLRMVTWDADDLTDNPSAYFLVRLRVLN